MLDVISATASFNFDADPDPHWKEGHEPWPELCYRKKKNNIMLHFFSSEE